MASSRSPRTDLWNIASSRSSCKQGPPREDFPRIPQDLFARPCTRTCMPGRQVFIKPFSERPLQDFGQDLHIKRTSKSALWNSQDCQRRAFEKRAPRHIVTGAKWRDGCSSDINMGTAPQREQHDAHKLTRVRERYQRARGATTRAIRRAQNNGRAARATSAPWHNESDPTGAKRREGCVGDIKMSRVQSPSSPYWLVHRDSHNVVMIITNCWIVKPHNHPQSSTSRGFARSNDHRATARAIQEAQSM